MTANYEQPRPIYLSRGQVESITEHVARQLKLSPGDDLVPPIVELGGSVKYKDFRNLQESDSGSLIVHDERNFEIIVSYNTSPLRDRFTIAHELGHYVLHFLYPRQHGGGPATLQAMRYGSDQAEWEANWFAASLLMPSEAFRAAYIKAHGNISTVASEFGVSQSAADVRAKVLNLR